MENVLKLTASHAIEGAAALPSIPAPNLSGIFCQPVDESKKKVSAGHRSSELGTYGFSFRGHLVLKDVEKVLDTLLYNNGKTFVASSATEDAKDASRSPSMKIYRIKGVIHLRDDENNLYLFQGVHDIFDITRSSITIGSSTDTTDGLNKIIVIGKGLDIDTIQEQFVNCIAAA